MIEYGPRGAFLVGLLQVFNVRYWVVNVDPVPTHSALIGAWSRWFSNLPHSCSGHISHEL
jgi:hypothetical protein